MSTVMVIFSHLSRQHFPCYMCPYQQYLFCYWPKLLTSFLGAKILLGSNFCEIKTIFWPKIFWTKILMTQNIFWPKIFWVQKFVGPKIFKQFFLRKFCLTKTFMDPKFLDQNCWTQFFYPKSFLTQHFFNLNITTKTIQFQGVLTLLSLP